MKKTIGIISGLTTPFFFAAAVFAQAATPTTAPGSGVGTAISPCPPGDNPFSKLCSFAKPESFGQILGTVITIAFIIAVLIALAFLILGGMKWITSGGDKSGVEGARNQIIAAIIGLIIVFLAYFILNLVLGLFGLSLFDLKLPKFPGT